jgi:hypothetical protein
VEGDYSYFARVSRWERAEGDASGSVNPANAAGRVRAPWPHELVDRDPGGGRVFMNCKIRLDGGGWQGNGSSYNHGELPEGGWPKIAGTNQMYGDGGVAWFDEGYFNSKHSDMWSAGGTGGDTAPPSKSGLPHYINGAALSVNTSNNAYAPWFFYATGRLE